MVKIIVGLGNPGEKYKFTRHNLGFRVIENIAQKYKINFRHKKRYLLGSFREIYLLLPFEFINLSGLAVQKFLQHSNLSPQDLLVVLDDFSLTLGKIRYREKGSSAGHKGLQSIIDEVKTEEFSRLRLGIGPLAENIESEYFVLSEFKNEEKPIVDKMIEEAVSFIEQKLVSNLYI